MIVRFWGTRGSIPTAVNGTAVRRKIRQALLAASGRSFDDEAAVERFMDDELPVSVRHGYGGDSSCVEIEGGEHTTICDMGSGLRRLGQQVLSKHGPGNPRTYNFFMSHLHWDHLMGFPFFAMAYIPGNKIRVHGCHEEMEAALRGQHSAPCFPVDWSQLGADIEFIRLEPARTYEIDGFRVTPKLQRHPGDSYGYRFERDGRAVVYSTDAEHKLKTEEETEGFVAFFRDADLVIFDAMYSLAEMVTVREDWGHSSNIVGVDLCRRAGVKQLCMFHHEPMLDDAMIDDVLAETMRYGNLTSRGTELKVTSAYDGLVLEV